LLQSRDGSFAADGRKVVEEFVQALTSFEVVKQCLKGDTSSPENGYSAQNVPIFDDHLVHHGSSLARAGAKTQQTAFACDFQLK